MLHTGLITDLYQLTMAQGYWCQGWAERTAVFHWTYRRAPFAGNGVLVCGMQTLVEALENWGFSNCDIEYLASLEAADSTPLFRADFLGWLATQRWTGEIDALAEGTWALPRTPLVRVTGPLVQAQLVETMLLTILNFQTLVATKAARVVRAAEGDEVLEFGLRRAQGIDGGISASRASYIGGCRATSNVEAGKRFGIPVKGTHAHSWVMAFDDEADAFERYSKSLPNNVVLLVDTYDTLQGIRNAVAVGLAMQSRGEKLLGIRLDSGDLAQFSIQARQMFDDAGLHYVRIVASSDLDEYAIRKLKQQGAAIDVWGVGTKLVTAFDQPALGGVYKLGAIADDSGALQPRIKRSDDAIKVSDPGQLSVSRVWCNERWYADLVHQANETPEDAATSHEVSGIEVFDERLDGNRFLPSDVRFESLLRPLMRGGKALGATESIEQIRERAARELKAVDVLRTGWEQPEPLVLWSRALANQKTRMLASR